MKPITKQSGSKAAFTIVELLTVMSIIIILIGLLVPGLNMAKRYSRLVTQKNQFHSIDNQLELFNAEWDGYPPSEEVDEASVPYCGAMKLGEAMMGLDLLGFNPDSHFRSDGTTDGTTPLYNVPGSDLSTRRKYLSVESANAYRLNNLYGAIGSFNGNELVLCDVYRHVSHRTTGKKVGMPILYYKADISGTVHDVTNPDNPQNIYDYKDNDALVLLGMPWENPPSAGGPAHPMASSGITKDGTPASATKFYENIRNSKITIATGRPYRSDSYILLSAGFDGQYGTDDDVFNFQK